MRTGRRRAPTSNTSANITFLINPPTSNSDAGADLRDRRTWQHVQLRKELASAHDRPGDQMAKEHDEQQQLAKAADVQPLAAAGIDQHGDQLKAVERDADRQDHMPGDPVLCRRHGQSRRGDRIEQKRGVLERDQVGQDDGDADRDPLAIARFNAAETHIRKPGNRQKQREHAESGIRIEMSEAARRTIGRRGTGAMKKTTRVMAKSARNSCE